jgi:hypothetical protein
MGLSPLELLYIGYRRLPQVVFYYTIRNILHKWTPNQKAPGIWFFEPPRSARRLHRAGGILDTAIPRKG